MVFGRFKALKNPPGIPSPPLFLPVFEKFFDFLKKI